MSILIPAFNAESWIRDTIQSALSQTWLRKEIIVVDDGSRDQTLAVAKQFASETVSVVTQANQGAAASRNRALALSQGDYIQWLDADDLLAHDKIAKQIEALARHPGQRTLLSGAWGHFFYRPSRAKFVATALWCDLSPVEWLRHKMGEGLQMPNMTWLVSRALAEAAGPWDIRLSFDDDGEYISRIVRASDRVVFVPEARSFYRMSGADSLSTPDGSNRKLESLLLSMQLHINCLRSIEDDDAVRSACLRYLQVCLILVYPERPDFIRRMQQIAANLGGQLAEPRLSWKYAWVQQLFGWATAKRVQYAFNGLKGALRRTWDKEMYRLRSDKDFEAPVVRSSLDRSA